MEETYTFLSFHMKFLTFLNLWPRDGVLKPNTWKRLDSYFFILVLLPSTGPLTYDLISIIQEDDVPIAMVIEPLLAWVCLLGEHYLCFCFLNNRKRMKTLVEEISKFKRFAPIEDMIDIDKRATFYTKVLLIYTFFGSLIYVSVPMLPTSIARCEKTKSRSMVENGIPCGLVARVRLPVRADYTPMLQVVYLHQVYLVFMISLVVISLSMLLCGILMHATYHLQRLRKMLVDVSGENEENVKYCVVYHIAIITFCENINEAFGSQLMIHLCLTSLIISILGFELMMVNSTDFARFALHLMGWLCLLLLVCYYGQTLIDESSGVATDAYDSAWYSCSIDVQKDLMLMIVRAQKPITLNALNVGYMSLETFLKIIFLLPNSPALSGFFRRPPGGLLDKLIRGKFFNKPNKGLCSSKEEWEFLE